MRPASDIHSNRKKKTNEEKKRKEKPQLSIDTQKDVYFISKNKNNKKENRKYTIIVTN